MPVGDQRAASAAARVSITPRADGCKRLGGKVRRRTRACRKLPTRSWLTRYASSLTHALTSLPSCSLALMDRLNLFRKSGGRGVAGSRRVNSVRGFPFVVAYRIRPDDVYIVAVTHTSRRPGYWKHRA